MTSIENAREFLEKELITDKFDLITPILVDHSKHVLSQVIEFLEANERKSVKSIVEELKGKL